MAAGYDEGRPNLFCVSLAKNNDAKSFIFFENRIIGQAAGPCTESAPVAAEKSKGVRRGVETGGVRLGRFGLSFQWPCKG